MASLFLSRIRIAALIQQRAKRKDMTPGGARADQALSSTIFPATDRVSSAPRVGRCRP